LFLPIDEEDIKYIAPKIALYNFRTQLIGGGGWNNSTTLTTQGNYINGVFFSAKNTINEYSMDYINFRNLYRQYVHTSPEKSAAFGYDCGNLILSCIQNGGTSREDFRRVLSAVNNFTGVTGMVRFNNAGANSWIPIAQYRDGVIEFIKNE
jgi:ABC-type branched-subunit amino acid transport system substrate-binding protein